MAAPDDSFIEFVRDQLAPLHNVVFRRMFGGHGVYAGAKFFGIVHRGRLYFKTDETNRAPYRERGMRPFRVNARQTLKTYFEVPPDVLEDAEVLVDWALRAVASVAVSGGSVAQMRKRTGKKVL